MAQPAQKKSSVEAARRARLERIAERLAVARAALAAAEQRVAGRG